MLYAYVGFENLVVPAGEMDRPTRNLPRAIVGALATVTVLYVGVMVVVFGTLPEVSGRDNAVADAAEAFLGPTVAVVTSHVLTGFDRLHLQPERPVLLVRDQKPEGADLPRPQPTRPGCRASRVNSQLRPMPEWRNW